MDHFFLAFLAIIDHIDGPNYFFGILIILDGLMIDWSK